MDSEDILPRRNSDLLAALAREDLDPLSVDELHDRIAALRDEIARAERKIAFATSHKNAAEALFRR